MNIKIMTFNIMHGLDYKLLKEGIRNVNFVNIKDIILKYNPDIISINEIYGASNINNEEFFDQVDYLKSLIQYPYCYFSKAISISKGDYGNAIFSKYVINDIKKYDILDAKSSSSLKEHRVITSVNILGINVISTHFGLLEEEQENGYHKLLELIKDNKKIIFLGDLNMDVNNKIIKNIMNELNSVSDNSYTFPSIMPIKKIDYIFYKGLDEVNSLVIKEIVSDHYPIIAEFKMGE